jgi:fatty-acid desaturase
MGWFWRHSPFFLDYSAYSALAPKVAEDPWLAWMDRNVNLLQLFWGLACFLGAFGWSYFSGAALNECLGFGLKAVLFGVFVKTFLVIYLVNLVDVINHTVGYRNVDTRDGSTNSFLMFALHLGGAVSWHNNHHARASYFSVKYRWWEFDAHLQMLRVLAFFGLVSDIKALSFVNGKRRALVLAPSKRKAS